MPTSSPAPIFDCSHSPWVQHGSFCPMGVALPMPGLWLLPRTLSWRFFPGSAATSAHNTPMRHAGRASKQPAPKPCSSCPLLLVLLFLTPSPPDDKMRSPSEAMSPCTLPPPSRAFPAFLSPAPGYLLSGPVCVAWPQFEMPLADGISGSQRRCPPKPSVPEALLGAWGLPKIWVSNYVCWAAG